MYFGQEGDVKRGVKEARITRWNICWMWIWTATLPLAPSIALYSLWWCTQAISESKGIGKKSQQPRHRRPWKGRCWQSCWEITPERRISEWWTLLWSTVETNTDGLDTLNGHRRSVEAWTIKNSGKVTIEWKRDRETDERNGGKHANEITIESRNQEQ